MGQQRGVLDHVDCGADCHDARDATGAAKHTIFLGITRKALHFARSVLVLCCAFAQGT